MIRPSLIVLSLCSVAAADDVALLRGLKPLQKVHYCWPVERDQLVARDPRLAEYVRITRSIGVRGEWGSGAAEELKAAVELCKPHGASIALHYSPWHSTYGQAEIEAGPDPREQGDRIEQAYVKFDTRMTAIVTLLATENAEQRANVQVSNVFLDTEVFKKKAPDEPDAAEWNIALTAKLDRFYEMSVGRFPGVPVRWYNRGTEDRLFIGDEQGDGYATSLYASNDIDRTRSHYRWSVARSPDGRSMPWIALGGGYFWDGNVRSEWTRDRAYSTLPSFQLGSEINIHYYGDHPDVYAPWHAAEAVVFYPHPFANNWPYWTEHFVAYVRGANGSPMAEDVRRFANQMGGPGRVVSFDSDGDGDVDLRDFAQAQRTMGAVVR